MSVINTKKTFAISFLIFLSLSLSTSQVYRLNVIQGINASKDNTVNDAFQNYRSNIDQGIHVSKDNIVNVTQKTNASKITLVNSTFPNPANLSIKIAPPNKGVYQSAITDFGGTEDDVTAKKILDYEKMIGKKIVWAYFSNNWGSGIK
ncbi:MAG: hypothetical protein M3Z01_06830, partial [Thermoproteota archaeon]|nr:hypothetical protein [Thermoproteota archaeon]